MKQPQVPFILCIDDDVDDLQMLREAFDTCGSPYQVRVATDGEDALRQLHAMTPEYPCLIVLDVNMPRVDGRETLLALRADTKLNQIPVVAYSTSSSPLDKLFFNRHNVAFFIKPNHFDELETVAAKMLHYCVPTAGNGNALPESSPAFSC